MTNRLRRSSLALACCCWLAACAPGDERPSPAAGDAPGVVSLAPHLTELVFSAGAGQHLVGVVEYSDYPEEARAIPRIGDAFNVDYERLAELDPDLILAWKSGTPVPVRERLESLGFTVTVLETLTLEDIPERLIELGQTIGDEKLSRSRAEEFRGVLRSLRGQAQGKSGVSVFYQVAADPLYTVGGKHFISEIIRLCGGRNIFEDLAEPAAAVSHEAVLAQNPQLILSDQRQLQESRVIWAKFSSLAATGSATVRGVDADLITRPTLRLAEGARQVCAAIDSARRDEPDQ